MWFNRSLRIGKELLPEDNEGIIKKGEKGKKESKN